MKHSGGTTSVSPVIIDKSSSLSLYHFEFIDIHISVWVPDNGSIFKDRSYIRFIGLHFDFRLAGPQVALKKTSHLVGFLNCGIYVGVP